ncbi:MAG: 1-acyl-sn-glycerol-3-phosphate acyltransferase [bacterium]|nr:1-acyl-sn-glycerol-3-phosphate acyltransferase [bacterium]
MPSDPPAPVAHPLRPAASGAVRPWRPGIAPLYRATAACIRLLARLWLRFEVVHSERIPAEGPVLVTPTHTSFLDPPLLGSHLEREAHFMAREGILKAPLLGAFCAALNAHAIRRGASDREAIRTCREVLRAGWPLIFFPEGTRSPDGRLGRVQGGWVMVLEALPGVPYLPVVIQDTWRALPKGKFFPRPRKVRMIVGEPAHLPPREAHENARAYNERCCATLEAQWRALGAR